MMDSKWSSKDIEIVAANNQPMPAELLHHQQWLYLSLRSLSQARESMSLKQFTDERQKLFNGFAEMDKLYRRYEATASSGDFKLGEDFVKRLLEGLKTGKDVGELLPLACTALAVLTGNDSLRGSVIEQTYFIEPDRK